MNKHLSFRGDLPSTLFILILYCACACNASFGSIFTAFCTLFSRGRAVAVLSEGPCAATQQARVREAVRTIWEFPKIRGTDFGVLITYKKDPTI